MISMCGVAGAISFSGEDTIPITVAMQESLQHRGQEGAGLAYTKKPWWSRENRIYGIKDFGLVHDVLSKRRISKIRSPISIAHNRYSTTGKADNRRNLQPIVAKHRRSAIAHNGNLVNTQELRERMERDNFRFYSTTDTEVIAGLIHPLGENIIKRIIDAMRNDLEGAYSVVIVTRTKLIAFRDPYGIRPLFLGKLNDMWLVASETCAFDAVGGEFVRNIRPGELLTISLRNNSIISSVPISNDRCHLCVFEAIYFSRPDSCLEGIQVCDLRQKLGGELAKESKDTFRADVFGAIPNSGIESGIGFSRQLGTCRDDPFMADRYRAVQRTFIDPDQNVRRRAVSKKLHPYKSKIEDKAVGYIDDSIVRGNNTSEINRMLREFGANIVDAYIASPPILHPCPYGIDTAEQSKLIASNYSTKEEIARAIGADSVHYLSIEGMYRAIPFSKSICDACFTGNYPTPIGEFSKEKFD